MDMLKKLNVPTLIAFGICVAGAVALVLTGHADQIGAIVAGSLALMTALMRPLVDGDK